MIALFGGTFNPLHNGHIALARELRAEFELDSVQFVPSFLPVHRDEPEISAAMRQHLVALSISPYPELTLNRCEIERAGPSYTVDTLRAVAARADGRSLCWLMGADSFNSFPGWKSPQEILRLAHLIVCERPGVLLDRSIYPEHQLQPGQTLNEFRAGKIAFYSMQPNPCSSTVIRQRLQQAASTEGCLSEPVLEFIRKNQLYRH